jgi:nicotinamidase-related amidase
MADFEVVLERTALINVDMQNCFVDGATEGLVLLERINRLAVVCREAGILVIHTRHVLRPDGSNMGLLGEIPKVRDGLINKGAVTAELHSGLFVDPRDLLLDKPRFGAFYGTDLELILRTRGIDTIIVCGISSPVCCDTTAREANARDFRVLFLSDGTACAGPEPEADRFHRATLEILEGLFARVATIDEVRERIATCRA